MGATSPVKQPFCSQLEERLLLWLEYHPHVVSYARGDIGPQFAAAYRLPIPKHAPFVIGYTFEGNPQIAAGNPCQVLREINEQDKIYYYKDFRVDPK